MLLGASQLWLHRLTVSMSNSSTHPTLPESTAAADDIAALVGQLTSASLKQQLSAIAALQAQGESGVLALVNFVRAQALLSLSAPAAIAVGKAHQVLVAQSSALVQSFLSNELAQGPFVQDPGWVADYQELQRLLAHQDYEAADRLTTQKLCELAGRDAVERKWVYFTETDRMPIADLRAIDGFWRAYSEDRFGFSRQREIWLGVNQNWERLWEKLDWKAGNIWTRYPGEFTWSLSAPLGHLPLSNQLRGVRTIAALFDHPAWTDAVAD